MSTAAKADLTVIEDESGEGVDKRRRKAYQRATTALRAAHKDEFDGLYQKECEALGVPYERRLTPRERAQATIDALREQFPDLS